ncbi:MAG: protein kinase [Pirellulales bacterium]
MTSPDSTSHNQDPEQTEGVGRDGLDVTSNYTGSGATDATGAFDSKTRPLAADATAAFDSSGVPGSGSGSFQERMRSSNSSALIGSVIGGYKIVSALGQGGMGRFFRADDSSGRPVAIKLLSPDLARSSEALARFKQEGLIASQINHSRCVFVHRVDEESGTPFIAMELMTGQTLKDLIVQKGPLPFAEAVRLILQCIEGLVEAHSRGMIHRDIKPANCYLDTHGNVKIGDFGLARSLVSDSELTQTGAFIGTPLFASPEQLLGQNIDVRSDIYSLTATLYFLLAGKAPFESPHAAQVIARIASSDPPPFSTVEIEVPEELERIVMKGLSRDPATRYQSFIEMQTELMALLAPKPETANVVRRVIAALADHFLLSILIGTMSILILPKWIMEGESKLLANLVGAGVTAIYFLFAESLFSTSLGKAAMRIHIADARTGRRPTLGRVFVRVLSFSFVSVVIELVFFAILYVTGWIRSDIVQGLTIALASPLTWLLYFVTWRSKGRRQMLHDWLSRTECLIPAPPVIQNTELDIPEFVLPVVKSQHPLPETLGRFRIRNQIDVPGADDSIRWLNGDDPALERSVWIAVTNDTEIDYEQQQCTKDPSTRLRFIEQSVEGSQRWYAYVAPEGIPLKECLAHGVHFAWPVTSFVFRQLLNHFHSVKNTNLVASVSKLSDWWIDRAGRLSIVSLDSAIHNNPPAACLEQIQAENATNYRELIQSVSLLALPKNHRLRKKFCKQKTGEYFCLLAREALPPLRSLNFCESIASGKHMPSLQTLESQLVQLNRGSHAVTSKTRFFNSILSVAFSVPLLSAVAFLLLFPPIVHIIDVRNKVQMIATLNYVAQADSAQDNWWDGASGEQRAYWTSDVGRQKLADLEVRARKRLTDVYANLGKFERSIVDNIPMNSEKLLEPPIYKLPNNSPAKASQDNQKDSDNATVEPAEVTSSESSGSESLNNDSPKPGEGRISKLNRPRPGLNFSVPGKRPVWSEDFDEAWNESLLNETLMIANSDDLELSKNDRVSQKLIYAGAGIVGLLALWNWLTFGGISARLTGICFVNRDGTRMGILKSAWRSLIVFAPVLVLLVLLANWPIISIRDLWWTNQIKLLLIFSPLGYLASTLIWNNRTITDIFSGTTSIPR